MNQLQYNWIFRNSKSKYQNELLLIQATLRVMKASEAVNNNESVTLYGIKISKSLPYRANIIYIADFFSRKNIKMNQLQYNWILYSNLNIKMNCTAFK